MSTPVTCIPNTHWEPKDEMLSPKTKKKDVTSGGMSVEISWKNLAPGCVVTVYSVQAKSEWIRTASSISLAAGEETGTQTVNLKVPSTQATASEPSTIIVSARVSYPPNTEPALHDAELNLVNVTLV